MKQLTTFFLLLAFGINSHSQNYISFPLDNTSWFNGFYQCDDLFMNCLFYGPYEYYTAGDTLINNILMTKVQGNQLGGNLWTPDNIDQPSEYVGAMREDSGKVYFVPFYQEDEMLLFDFTLEPGDTIQVFAGGWEPTLTVESVTYEDFSGVTRKVIYFTSGPGRWIEGIGSDRGIFYEITLNLSGYYNLQECVRTGEDYIFEHEEGELNCSALSIQEENLKFSIYPNPNNGLFKIEGFKGNSEVELLDQSGRIIGKSKISAETEELNFQNFHPAPGIYLVKIIHKESTHMTRIAIE